MKKKDFYLFAGVNGAGKSTLFNIIDENIKKSFRINSDEIVKEFGKWENELDQIKAAKIAVKLRNNYLKKGFSFNEETTLTGKTILKLIDKIKSENYKLHLFYIGVENSEIAKKRIKKRVAMGGHDIPDEIVDRRYYESIRNLEKILDKFDNVTIYDNTEKFRLVVKIINKRIVKISDKLPDWIKNTIKNKLMKEKKC